MRNGFMSLQELFEIRKNTNRNRKKMTETLENQCDSNCFLDMWLSSSWVCYGQEWILFDGNEV